MAQKMTGALVKDTVTNPKLVLRYIIEGATLGGTFGDGESDDTVVVDNDYVKVTAGTDANKKASAEYK